MSAFIFDRETEAALAPVPGPQAGSPEAERRRLIKRCCPINHPEWGSNAIAQGLTPEPAFASFVARLRTTEPQRELAPMPSTRKVAQVPDDEFLAIMGVW